MVDAPMPQHRCGGNCDYDPDSFTHHDIPTLDRIADLYLGDVRLLVSHVIDLSSRVAQLDPAHRGVPAMCTAAHQIAAITAERQLKLGELLDEVIRRKVLAASATLTRPPLIGTTECTPMNDLSICPTTDSPCTPGPFQPSSSFPLLSLPGEIRNLIYTFCLTHSSSSSSSSTSPTLRPYSSCCSSPRSRPDKSVTTSTITPALLATNRQIRAEATPILYGANTVELDVFAVPRFMFQIAGASRWLRRLRLTGLAELKVLGDGGVRGAGDDELDGCNSSSRRVSSTMRSGGEALRRIVSGTGRRARRGEEEQEAAGGQEEDRLGGGGSAGRMEPLRLQLYLLHRATNLDRLEVVWCGGEESTLPLGAPKPPPASGEAAARDVYGLLYPWLAAVAGAKGEKKAAAKIVRPFTHSDDRGSGIDRAVFRKKLGALLENEAGEDMIIE